MDISKQRKIAEDKLIQFMNELDPSGYNGETYRIAFSKMSDKEFTDMCKNMISTDDINFSLDIKTLGKGKDEIDMPKVKAVAKKYDIPLEEYLVMPFRNPKGSPTVTMTRVPIIYCPVRRFFQQMLQHKNAISNDNSKINPLTGQVTGEDKTASTTNVQTYALAVSNQTNSIKEFLGPRSDDSVSKQQMLSIIEKTGKVRLGDLDIKTHNKQAINTVETFMKAACIDLVFEGNDNVVADDEAKLYKELKLDN